MPRLRRPAPPLNGDDVPAALFDYRHPAWCTETAARAWCLEHGVPRDVIRADVADVERGPQRRRADALAAWAMVNGDASSRCPAFPDWHLLRRPDLVAAGSPTGPRPGRCEPGRTASIRERTGD